MEWSVPTRAERDRNNDSFLVAGSTDRRAKLSGLVGTWHGMNRDVSGAKYCGEQQIEGPHSKREISNKNSLSGANSSLPDVDVIYSPPSTTRQSLHSFHS